MYRVLRLCLFFAAFGKEVCACFRGGNDWTRGEIPQKEDGSGSCLSGRHNMWWSSAGTLPDAERDPASHRRECCTGWLTCAALWPGGISTHHTLDCYSIRRWKNPKSWSSFTAFSHQRTPWYFLWQEASKRNYHWVLYACNVTSDFTIVFCFFKEAFCTYSYQISLSSGTLNAQSCCISLNTS